MERTIVLENTGDQPVGLKDTQNRVYRLGLGGKVRISQTSLQDILDYPASKVIFEEELVKVRNVSMDTLFNMGLTEDEIRKYSLDDYSAIVIAETIEESDEEEVVEETIIPVEKPAVKPATKPAAKKTTTAKKPTTKKASSTKTK
jgi:hypothetical protein